MIELPVLERHYRHRKSRELRIVGYRIPSERAAEFRIEVIALDLSVGSCRALPQEIHSPVAQQPQSDIHQIIMSAAYFVELLDRRFLKHEIKCAACLAVARYTVNTVILSQGGIYPNAEAHHVGFRDGRQF